MSMTEEDKEITEMINKAYKNIREDDDERSYTWKHVLIGFTVLGITEAMIFIALVYLGTFISK